MKLLSNPFVIGKYVDKDYFCDREKDLCNCYLLKKVCMSSSAKSCSLNMAKVFPHHWWSDSINAFKASPGICSSR